MRNSWRVFWISVTIQLKNLTLEISDLLTCYGTLFCDLWLLINSELKIAYYTSNKGELRAIHKLLYFWLIEYRANNCPTTLVKYLAGHSNNHQLSYGSLFQLFIGHSLADPHSAHLFYWSPSGITCRLLPSKSDILYGRPPIGKQCEKKLSKWHAAGAIKFIKAATPYFGRYPIQQQAPTSGIHNIFKHRPLYASYLVEHGI